jgi:hypothetical protein
MHASASPVFCFFLSNNGSFVLAPGDNESSLVVQVRTTRVGNVNATGFTGIAIKEGNAEVIQVNLMPGGIVTRIIRFQHTFVPS